MGYTREQWARAFLAGIGNNNPSQEVVNWVINWTAAEGSSIGGQGTFNLLNTTQPMPGSHGGGSQGNIQYFNSFASGVQANDIVLQNGLYPSLLNALKNNDTSALGFGSSGPSSGVMANLKTWCGGCGYGGWFAKQLPASNWLSQIFPGNATGVPPTVPPSTSGAGTPLSNVSPPGAQNVPSSGVVSDVFSALGLPSAASVADITERFVILTVGVIIIVVGINVIFFSQKSDA